MSELSIDPTDVITISQAAAETGEDRTRIWYVVVRNPDIVVRKALVASRYQTLISRRLLAERLTRIRTNRRRSRPDFAPRALPQRPTIAAELTPFELHSLIELLNEKAAKAATRPDRIDYADFLFRRAAELREAAR